MANLSRRSITSAPLSATQQEQPLRALEIFTEIPPGCIAFPVKDNSSAPHLKCGEFAVCDTNDREPQHGEVFLVQWCTGGRDIKQVVVRQHRGIDGKDFEGWWTRKLAASSLTSAQKNAAFDDIQAGKMRGGEASAFLSLCMADGPQLIEHFRKKLVGRVIGILGATMPAVIAVERGGERA